MNGDTTLSSDGGGWQCPACDRRVPGRIRECRCGFVQPSASFEGAEPTRSRWPRLVALALLTGGLAAAAALALLPGTPTPPAVPVPEHAPVAPLAEPLDERVQPSAEESFPAGGNAPSAALSLPVPVTAVGPATPAAPLEDLVSRVVPAVALVQAGSSRGTGFFIARDQVLTNAHVVGGQSVVRLQVGEAQYEARVGNVSAGTDLAVLKVVNPSPVQPVLRMGSVEEARVGEEVIAIGSALGVLSNTVTRGIVSAVRKVGEVTLLQTDAAINPGNSGGPLISRSGLVIGVNSLRVAQHTAEGVAFAVAIDHATPLLNGERAADGQTPLGSLTQLLGGRSEGDDRRARGEADYVRVLEWASRHAGELDSYWTRYASSCVSGARPAGDRAWFAVLAPSGPTLSNSSTVDCASWLDTVRTAAGRIRDEMVKASETARQNGVYPGTVRDLRRRHRLDWAGWDR